MHSRKEIILYSIKALSIIIRVKSELMRLKKKFHNLISRIMDKKKGLSADEIRYLAEQSII